VTATLAASPAGDLPIGPARGAYLFPLSLLGPLSLWDFYIGEVRVFDFLGLVLALAAAAALPVTRATVGLNRSTILITSLLFLLILVYSVIGIAQHPDNLKPSIGMLLGVSALMIVATLPLSARAVDACIRYLAYAHLTAFFLQLLYYYAAGDVLNYHALLGVESRLVSIVFRPAGLFLEPAIYCFFVCSLFLLRRQRAVPLRLLDALLLISMVLSLSLWGVSIAYLLFAIFWPRRALVTTLAVGVVLLVSLKTLDYVHLPVYLLFSSRLSDLSSDASAQGRFGGTLNLLRSALANPSVVFGNGINNFFEEHGSNGLAFIINSLGLIGALLLLSLCLLLAPPRQWVVFLLGMAIVLTAAPLWKTLYFWAWMGLMLKPVIGTSRERTAGVPAPIAPAQGTVNSISDPRR
jgi:hypothetical protein